MKKFIPIGIGIILAVGIPLSTTLVGSQIVPPGSSPTTPQPTVPCTPINGCGRGPGTIRNLAYAWIDRYCNGSAVPTPPGETTFALNYALGGQATEAAQFFGTATVNSTVIPTAPLFTLQPGQKDTRIRTAVVPSGAIFEVTLTATGVPSGNPVFFANGSTTRIRSASGPCPGSPASVPPPATPPTAPPISGTPVPLFPNLPPLTPTLRTLPPGTLSPTL